VATTGLAVAAFLLFVARPLAVFVSLAPFGMSWRQMAMVSWVGLRGAVPIVLATWPRIAGAPGADRVFDIVFFVVFSSVLVQGVSVPWVARTLGLVEPPPPEGAPGEVHGAHTLTVVAGAACDGQRILDLHLPRGALIYLVERGDAVFVPQGETRLLLGDTLKVVLEAPQEASVLAALSGPTPAPSVAASPPPHGA
jgi:cell volume regulation protein A